MAYFRVADIPGLLADFGVDVVLGATTVKGLVDDGEELMLEGEASVALQQGQKSVIVQTGALPGLQVGSAVTVDGQSHTVRERRKIGDGALTRLLVE